MVWSMFWCGQCFGALNVQVRLIFEVPQQISLGGQLHVSEQSMLWHSQCFGTFDIIEPLMFWRSRTYAGERQSLRDLKYQPHLYTDCTKTLTALKHRPHRNTDNAGPKGQLVIIFF